MTTTRITPTTTLLVERPTDFRVLEEAYQLICYELPKDLPWRVEQANYIYGDMHNRLREQLTHPYRVFTHDELDGKLNHKWVVYVLYPRDAHPTPLTMPICSDVTLPLSEIRFSSLPLHVLLKLLQVAYIHGSHAGRFVGHDKCYVHAKRLGQSHVCVHIELEGDIQAQSYDLEQRVKVIGHARLLTRFDYPKKGEVSQYAYYGRKIARGIVYFLHLKQDEIKSAKAKGEPVYGMGTQKGKRTTLAYHDLDHLEACTGKILFDFIRDYTSFLRRYGITSRPNMRSFFPFVPQKAENTLDLTHLSPIGVFDNRLNQALDIQKYLSLFRIWRPDLTFTTVSDLSTSSQPLLVLQDYRKEDFQEGGHFDGQTDPYLDLYGAYVDLPKQSLTVNPQKSSEMASDAYLQYPLPKWDDTDLPLHLEVALTQLYLKAVVCTQGPLGQRLPFLPTDLMFVRKQRNVPKQAAYETAMYVENDQLHFLDLRDPQQRECFFQWCDRFKVDWEEHYDRLLRKYRKVDEQGNRKIDKEGKTVDLPRYDIILGPGLFIELEDFNERVLYDYDEIVKRQESVDIVLPTEAFKLLPYYDEKLRNKTDLSVKQLLERGLLKGDAQTQDEEHSRRFYFQLEDYDAYLDEIQQVYPALSFTQLTQEPFIEAIRYIFAFKPDKNGLYNIRQFKGYYQDRGWFASDKAKDVHMYEDIWYDAEHCYMVGSVQTIKRQQPRAHLIRHFDAAQGREQFDILPLLHMTSVQFVRRNQYTVYPYPFHLIDLYVENVLRFRKTQIQKEEISSPMPSI